MSDLLDRLYEELSTGGPSRLSEVAPRYLRTQNGAVAETVLAALLCQDVRFVVQNGAVAVAPEKDPFAGRPLDEIAFAVLDFETSGCRLEDRAIEVGLVVVEAGRETASFESLLNPGLPVSPFVQRLTGIRTEDLAGQPRFAEVWPEISSRLERRMLVAHNLPFDRGILKREVALLGGDPRVGSRGLCTVRLSRKLHPTEESHCLDAVAGRFGFTFAARHRALDDARVTSRLLLRLLDEATEHLETPTWEGLCRWLSPPARAKRTPRRPSRHPPASLR